MNWSKTSPFTGNRNVWPLRGTWDCRSSPALERESNWTERHTHKEEKLIPLPYVQDWPSAGSFVCVVCLFLLQTAFRRIEFASAPMIIIGSIPKSSSFYLLHQKIHMGLRIIIYAQLFSSFDFSFDITSWFKAWCTINFLQMCSNS